MEARGMPVLPVDTCTAIVIPRGGPDGNLPAHHTPSTHSRCRAPLLLCLAVAGPRCRIAASRGSATGSPCPRRGRRPDACPARPHRHLPAALRRAQPPVADGPFPGERHSILIDASIDDGWTCRVRAGETRDCGPFFQFRVRQPCVRACAACPDRTGVMRLPARHECPNSRLLGLAYAA